MRPEWVLRETGDAGILLGEPESGIRTILSTNAASGGDGLAVMHNGRLVANRSAPIDLQRLPVPAFHLLAIERYRYELMGNRFLLLEMTRGCPFACTFCSREMYGKPVRRKALDQMLEEIERARQETDFRCAYFIDLEFTFHRDPVVDLCETMLSRGWRFEWTCQTRLDQVDEELLRLMRRAGCRLIHLGVETGAQRQVEALKKGIPLEKIREQHALVKSCGIETALFFLLGHPEETEEEQHQTIEFACTLNPDYASFHIASPYPGTAFHEIASPFEEPFPAFDHHHHDLDNLERMRRYALRRFYLRPCYFWGSLQPRRLRLALSGARLLLRLLAPGF
jgi:radical SAM superfamily enzyme YgiQ (UPF0313 family)